MATKNILLAIADNQTVATINEALGNEWLTTPVASEADALALLEAGSFDALLADFNLGDSDASELLNQAAEKCPEMTRFLLVYEADLALVAAKVSGSPEILPKPVEPAALHSRIEAAFRDPSSNDVGLATGFDTASAIPAVYEEVLQALNSPEVTSQQVGDIIATDDALNQEILLLTRSAYLGLPGKLIEPVDAVELLGFETVQTLVMALRYLAEHSHVRPGYLSLETLWQHSTRVAQIARDLVLFETKDRARASQALAAGLVHDLGKVVLAVNYDDLYGRVHSLARKQPVPLWEIEKEMFGASHGEIGACLLGMWNLPGAIVDAAALHHEPPLGEHTELTPLAAVHIANVLEHQLHPGDELRVLPVMNAPFLNELGLLQRLPIWRATFAKQLSPTAPTETGEADPLGWVAAVLQSGATSRSTNQIPAPVAATQTSTAAPAEQPTAEAGTATRTSTRNWAHTGLVAIALLVLAIIFRTGEETTEPSHVKARTVSSPAAMVVAPAPAPPTPEPVPTLAPAVPVVEVKSPEAPPIVVTPTPEPPVTAETIVTNVAPVSLPPKAVAPAFRLNGVIYGVSNPSAVVNGTPVYVGEKVNGATVISIGRNEVTLEINGARSIIELPGTH